MAGEARHGVRKNNLSYFLISMFVLHMLNITLKTLLFLSLEKKRMAGNNLYYSPPENILTNTGEQL